MELEAEAEANMTPDELREFKRMQIEAADNALTDDLFGGGGADGPKGKGAAVAAGDKLVLKDLPSHLKHARKCANALRVRLWPIFGFISVLLVIVWCDVMPHTLETFINFHSFRTMVKFIGQKPFLMN